MSELLYCWSRGEESTGKGKCPPKISLMSLYSPMDLKDGWNQRLSVWQTREQEMSKVRIVQKTRTTRKQEICRNMWCQKQKACPQQCNLFREYGEYYEILTEYNPNRMYSKKELSSYISDLEPIYEAGATELEFTLSDAGVDSGTYICAFLRISATTQCLCLLKGLEGSSRT